MATNDQEPQSDQDQDSADVSAANPASSAEEEAASLDELEQTSGGFRPPIERMPLKDALNSNYRQ